MAAAPVAELPPRTRTEVAALPSVDRLGKKVSGTLRLSTMAQTAVTKPILSRVSSAVFSGSRMDQTHGSDAASSSEIFLGFLATKCVCTVTHSWNAPPQTFSRAPLPSHAATSSPGCRS